MELKSFREILLKKSEESENPYLQSFIKHAKDDLIVERVLESLEKMAQPTAAMGRAANSAITAFAGQLTKGDVEQIRDALAHHISRYRGALKSGNREVADKHLAHIVPMMHLVGRAAPHSNGNIALDYRSTTPWESNYTTVDRHPHNGKLKEGTKDLRRRPKKVRDNSTRGVPDWRYLEMPPHQHHADTQDLPLPESGYPFEEIQVGSQDAIDQGKAWLPIEDLDNVNEYVPHPFDNHPIHKHADHIEHERSPEAKEQFAQDLITWKTSDHHKNWLASQKERFQQNPEAYKARGTKKPGHFWDGIKLLDQPSHAKKGGSQDQPSSSQEVDYDALPEALKQKFSPKSTSESPKAPEAANPEVKAPSAPVDSEDSILAHIKSTLTPEHIQKMSPEMKKILKIKD